MGEAHVVFATLIYLMRLITVFFFVLSVLAASAQTLTGKAAELQWAINFFYGYGGETVDEARGLKTITKLANQGYEDAKVSLANIYVHGSETVPQDCAKGTAMIKALAEKGNSRACAIYAEMYLNGICVAPNDDMAFKYSKKGAEGEHRNNKYILAGLYVDGRGCQPDTIEAMSLYRELAEKEYISALWPLARLHYALGDDEETLYWLRRGVEADEPDCMYGMALVYKNGDFGLEPDADKALGMCNKLIEKYDYADAYLTAGNIYKRQRKLDKAREYYGKLAARGHPLANIHLCETYLNIDDRKVFEGYKKVSEMKMTPENSNDIMYAYVRLGLCHWLGKGTPVDAYRGAKIIYDAADNGYDMAIDYIREYNIKRQ